MTQQEAYEQVRAWLTRPGAQRAQQGQEVCRYRITMEDGTVQKCAVGCLLSEEDLDRSMGSFLGDLDELFHEYGVPDYFQPLVYFDDDMDVYHSPFLQEMQNAHDNVNNWSEDGFNVVALDNVARSFQLTVVG